MAIWADATFVWNPNHGGTPFDEISSNSSSGLTEGDEITEGGRDGREYDGAGEGSRFDGLVAAANPQSTGLTLMMVTRAQPTLSGGVLWVGDKDSGGKYATMRHNQGGVSYDWRSGGWLNEEYGQSTLFAHTDLVTSVLVFYPVGGTEMQADLYVDGVLVETDKAASLGALDCDRISLARLDDSSPSSTSSGQMFAAATWDRDLTPAEVRALSSDPFSYPTDPTDPDDWAEGTPDTPWEGVGFVWDPNHDGSESKNLLNGGPLATTDFTDGAEVTKDGKPGREYDSGEVARFGRPIIQVDRSAAFPRGDTTMMLAAARKDASSGGRGLTVLADFSAGWEVLGMLDNGANTDFESNVRRSGGAGSPGDNYPVVIDSEPEDTDIHVIVTRVTVSGGNITVQQYVDTFANVTSQTESWAADERRIFRASVGRLDDDSPSNSSGLQVFAAAWWDRLLSDEEVQAVLADPYGFPGEAALSGAAASSMLMGI